MRRHIAALVVTLVVVLTMSFRCQGQQFSPRYSSYNNNGTIQVDLNGDGIPDFVTQRPGQANTLTELLSTGGGNFISTTRSIPANATPIASGDFNGDGKADLILFFPSSANQFQIAYGTGTGSFSSYRPISFPNNQYYYLVGGVVADFNGDGRPDLVIYVDLPYLGNPLNRQGSSQIFLLTNNGAGGFNPPVRIVNIPAQTNVNPPYLQVLGGDYDADGHEDLAVLAIPDSNNPGHIPVTFTALYGSGSGGFTSRTIATYSYNTGYFLISTADMNNDGTSDIVANDYGPMTIFYGQRNRTFTQSNVYPTGNAYRFLAPMLADVNGDGLKDIVYAGTGATAPGGGQYVGVSTLRQGANHSFSQQSFIPVEVADDPSLGPAFGMGLVGDYNRDGKPDVTLFTTSLYSRPYDAAILLNTDPVPDGTCQNPAPSGLHVCSPTANETVANPVSFAFSATSFYPVHKMEVWIDGTKRSETYEVFANVGFSNTHLTLPAGTHRVDLYEGAFDGTVQHTRYSINVK